MVVFFLIVLYAWTMARIILHECAHALAGRLAGFGISYVLVGLGAKLLDFRLGGMHFILRAYPSSGGTVITSLPKNYTKLKELAFSSAGLVVELSALGLLIWLYSMKAVRDSEYDLPVFILMVMQVYTVFRNAIPFKVRIMGDMILNDGMRIWHTLKGKDIYRESAAEDYLQVVHLYDPNVKREDIWLNHWSIDDILGFGNDVVVLTSVDEKAGFEKVKQYLENDRLLPAEKAYVCDMLASTPLRSKRMTSLLNEAYAITQRGLTYTPKAPPLLRTLGCLQVELGMIDEAIETLTPLSGLGGPLKDRSLCCAYLAKAHAMRGDKTQMKLMLKACRKSDKGGLIHRRFSKEAKAALRQARRRARRS